MYGDGTRGRLLRGAAEAAWRHGVHACTVQHVLETSDLSRRTFYKHFRSIEDVLDALFEVSTSLVLRTITDAAHTAEEPMERLIAGLDAYLELQAVGGRLIRELQAEALRPHSTLFPRRVMLMDALVELFGADMDRVVGHPIDRLLVRGLLFDVEGMVLYLQRRGPLEPTDVARIRAAHLAVLHRTLGVEGIALPRGGHEAG